MSQIDIICLANSRKHGGRCVAGLRTDGGGWLRPVGTLPDGTLYPPNYTLTNGSEIAVLDLVQVGVATHRPAPHQPENWVIDGTGWILKFRPIRADLNQLLKNALVTDPELLQGFSDRVPCSNLQQQPSGLSSLALVAPESLELYHQQSFSGRPQARGRFFLGNGAHGILYDLVITDPVWEPIILQQSSRTLRQTDSKFLVTVSLSEPFGMYCYKLIAAIVLLPTSIAPGW
jgi:hypothetical protein